MFDQDAEKKRLTLNNAYCPVTSTVQFGLKLGLLIANKIREFCHNFDVPLHFRKSGQGVGSSLMKAMAKVI